MRNITTNEDGTFRIQQVPPGSYIVTVESGDFQKQTLNNVLVSLGNTATFDIELKNAVCAVVEVTSEGVATIDPTSSKIQTDLSAQRLESIPKGTNFTSALKAAAPVRQEPTAGGIQIDGASGSENGFVIDGQKVTNFRTGTLNNNIPFQLIQEVQVKSNGFDAEFGGATGGVINVVTKRGSDDYHGEIAMQFEPSKFGAPPRRVLTTSTTISPTAPGRYIYPKREKYLNTFPSFYTKGAIIKQRLFYFLSIAPQYLVTERNWTFPDGGMRTYRSKDTRDYNFARHDGQLGDKLQLSATYLYNPVRRNGYCRFTQHWRVPRRLPPRPTRLRSKIWAEEWLLKISHSREFTRRRKTSPWTFASGAVILTKASARTTKFFLRYSERR